MFVVTIFSSGKDFEDVHVFLVSVAPESATTTVHRSLQEVNFLGEHSRGKLYDRDVVAAALQSDAQGGYAGNVWFLQPPPSWRSMPWHGMTPHTSGSALSAQMRFAAGVRFEMWIFSVLQPDPTTGYPLNYATGSRPSLQAQRLLITPWSIVRVRLRRVGFAQIPCRARLFTRGDQR